MHGRRGWALGGILIFGLACGGRPVAGDEEASPKAKVPAALQTVAEASGFTRTSTSAEVNTLIDRLCAHGEHVRSFTFGKTGAGQDLPCVVVAHPMVAGPAALAGDKRLVVLLLGNIHSGECAGKEALLMLLRELALNPSHAWLNDIVLLVAPNYNADGNDKVGPGEKHRKGQIGPMEMGTRENAAGLDLNRDFVKLVSPEGRALVALMDAWNPHLFIDCHTTNGSWHRYPLTYDVPHNPATPQAVRDLLRKDLIPAVTQHLEAKGMSTFYYGNFNRAHTQWTTYGHEPRYSTEYVGLRGRLAILSEAYAYIPYKARIFATKAFVEACVGWVRGHAAAVKAATSARDVPVSEVPIGAKAVAFEQPVVLKGYVLPEPVAGVRPDPRPRARAKPTEPADHTVEFIGDYVPARTVTRPFAYVLPPALAGVVERLRHHGIRVDRLTADTEVPVEVHRITSATKAAGAFQGVHLIQARASVRKETRRLAEGSFVARTDQPLGVLLVYLLEPETDDGYVTWDVFGSHLKVEADFPVLRVPGRIVLPLRPGAAARPQK